MYKNTIYREIIIAVRIMNISMKYSNNMQNIGKMKVRVLQCWIWKKKFKVE